MQHPDAREEGIIVNTGEFDKIVTEEVLQRADTVRGRRNGFRPTRNGD